jgi:hydroxymethylbilane synthase
VVTDRIRIASRGSELALWQAHAIRDVLLAEDSALQIEIEVIRTTGDRILDVPLARIGDRGLFTKELDEVLLAGGADIAVHSLKDVPTRLPEGLCLAAISERADPRDVVLCREGFGPDLSDLPAGARVGTSSLRRRAQLMASRRDLRVEDIRGNLNTRLSKLDAGAFDAILLAAAGVIRLGWSARISAYLDPVDWVPAVGQAALAVVARTDAEAVHRRLATVHHAPTAARVTAERAFLSTVEGGCQVPVGALATLHEGTLSLDGFVAETDGSVLLREQRSGPVEAAAETGERLAQRLLDLGGKQILDELRRRAAASLPGIPAP